MKLEISLVNIKFTYLFKKEKDLLVLMRNFILFCVEIELYRRKRVSVASNDGAATSFMIRPKKVGRITIKVTATSPLAGDGVERVLPVEPEGIPQFLNKAILVDLREKSTHESNFTIEIPRNAVPDSTRIEVTALGKNFFSPKRPRLMTLQLYHSLN